jgi:hypothetical protein
MRRLLISGFFCERKKKRKAGQKKRDKDAESKVKIITEI